MNRIMVLFFLVLLIFDSKAQTAEEYIQISNSEYDEGDYKGAIVDLSTAVELNPGDVDGY